MDEGPEERLVEEARRGGLEAFGEPVWRRERRVYGVVFRMAGNRSDADDLAQEVFLNAWKAIGSSHIRDLYRGFPEERRREPGRGQGRPGALKKNPLTRIAISSNITVVVLYISD